MARYKKEKRELKEYIHSLEESVVLIVGAEEDSWEYMKAK